MTSAAFVILPPNDLSSPSSTLSPFPAGSVPCPGDVGGRTVIDEYRYLGAVGDQATEGRGSLELQNEKRQKGGQDEADVERRR